MSIFRRNSKEVKLIIALSLLNLLIHLMANGNFGFHRDELLHIALGNHLDWGFKESPPFIAFISKTSSVLFGESVFAYRLFPSIFSAAVIFLIGLITMTLGGKRFAISVACLGAIVSPAFSGTGYLLQPVVFDQFFWTLAAYLLVRYIQTRKTSSIYSLGICTGLAMLNKYTAALYILSLALGLLLSPQRKLLWNKHFIGATGIALLIFSPNLIWQIQHHFPLINHLNELNRTHSDYISPLNSVTQELFIHSTATLIWLPGFFYLFFSRIRSKFIFLSLAFLFTFICLLLLHGKIYYGFGSFPALFSAGGLAWQKILGKSSNRIKYGLTAVVLIPSIYILPMVIPLLSIDKTLRFFQFSKDNLPIYFPLKWEDPKHHSLPQDYADMLGWDEIAADASKAWQMLGNKNQRSATIITGNYGQAGAIDHFGKKNHLPPVVCLNSSYSLWAPDSIETQYLIYIDDKPDQDLFAQYKQVKKLEEVTNPYAREKGTSVYLLSQPRANINKLYASRLKLSR